SADDNTSSSDDSGSTWGSSSAAAAGVRAGSNPTTRMPSATPTLATRPPMAPRPMTPSVRPSSSTPANAFLPDSTALCNTASSPSSPRANNQPGPMERDAMMSPATTSSFTALALAPGALNTGTPRTVIAATGMLLVPLPARPI